MREARDLHGRVGCPNVMIKVPATRAGLPAIEQLTAGQIIVGRGGCDDQIELAGAAAAMIDRNPIDGAGDGFKVCLVSPR
ncbi:MAG: transaldolase family protein [Verrucomicrobiales bacterium]